MNFDWGVGGGPPGYPPPDLNLLPGDPSMIGLDDKTLQALVNEQNQAAASMAFPGGPAPAGPSGSGSDKRSRDEAVFNNWLADTFPEEDDGGRDSGGEDGQHRIGKKGRPMSSAAVAKATREKARREKLNECFEELAKLCDPSGRSVKNDRVSVIADAIRVLTHLRVENNQLKQLNKLLEERVGGYERARAQAAYQQAIAEQRAAALVAGMQGGAGQPTGGSGMAGVHAGGAVGLHLRAGSGMSNLPGVQSPGGGGFVASAGGGGRPPIAPHPSGSTPSPAPLAGGAEPIPTASVGPASSSPMPALGASRLVAAGSVSVEASSMRAYATEVGSPVSHPVPRASSAPPSREGPGPSSPAAQRASEGPGAAPGSAGEGPSAGPAGARDPAVPGPGGEGPSLASRPGPVHLSSPPPLSLGIGVPSRGFPGTQGLSADAAAYLAQTLAAMDAGIDTLGGDLDGIGLGPGRLPSGMGQPAAGHEALPLVGAPGLGSYSYPLSSLPAFSPKHEQAGSLSGVRLAPALGQGDAPAAAGDRGGIAWLPAPDAAQDGKLHPPAA